jgi:hypothetical protein
MSRASIERRLEALERDADPEVGSWKDLVVAGDDGRDPITLSPAMYGIFDI